MKSRYLLILLSITVVLSSVVLTPETTQYLSGKAGSKAVKKDMMAKKHFPSEHFFLQRSFPDPGFDLTAYEKAIKQENQRIKMARSSEGFDNPWKLEGPQNIGGRINTIAVHPGNNNIIYVGNASGGVFKTTDGGTSWKPVFDDQPFLSIGCIVIDPVNPNTIYVGTGDPNISGYPFIGDGIYKSTDGGDSWLHLGLSEQRIISKIIVNPSNTSEIYAATMGLPFERNNDRGLYKSTDAGASWQQVLFLSDDAGICDLVMDFNNPQVLYAAGWNRIRNNTESITEGPETKIYKTTDGGSSWVALNNGLPSFNTSRIGIAMSALNPNILYASFTEATTYGLLGIYKTTNGGNTWVALGNNGAENAYASFGWYFGKIRVNPTNDNELFLLGVDLYKSTNGGISWFMSGPPWYDYLLHADKHDLHFLNANSILLSTDGGIYRSTDGGNQFTRIDNIPNTQFYRVGINPHQNHMYYGGAQDQGTMGGNASGINNWQRIFGGDGFQIIFDPENPDLFYVETQNGGLYYTDDGGSGWFNNFTNGIDPSDRRSWDMPFVMNNLNSQVLYTGTYRVYRNDYAPYDTWYPISQDLTKGILTHQRNHVISTFHQSPLNQNHLYAGTSDGLAWRSLNNGNSWQEITGTLPGRYITRIVASPNSENTVYVAHSGYKDNEYIPHLHKSSNNGTSWVDISGNLPQLAINDVLVIPGQTGDERFIFVATDGGVYATTDKGANWERVGKEMPVIPVYDIDYNPETKRLIAGTFARSMMTYPVDSIIKSIGINGYEKMDKLVVFPGLARDYINVELSGNSNVRKLGLYTLDGVLVKTIGLENGKNARVALNGLPTGVYIIHGSDGGAMVNAKFIKCN